MSRRGRHTVLESVQTAWTLLGDDRCLWVENLNGIPIDRVPLKLEDGREVQVGDHVTRIGGKKTAASWTVVEMLPGEWLTYCGQATSLDGTLALFQTRKNQDAFVAWIVFKESKTLFHFTPGNAGRCVETTHWEFTTPTKGSES